MSGGPKKCGKCEKTVYPVEEIICFDKSWHKGCFKCTVCNTTLNIKNAKGYEKLPYCNAHYPQLKSTAIADNPELQRIRQLNEVQSNAKYHKDFNENKGKFTAIADDPATQRAKEHQKIVSQAEYTSKRKESLSHIVDADPRHSATENDSQPAATSPALSIGQLVDYDPLNGNAGSLSRGYEPMSKTSTDDEHQISQSGLFQTNLKTESEQKKQLEQEQAAQSSSTNDEQTHDNPPANIHSAKITVRALYAYTAAEADEISFDENDELIDCEEVDDGWMIGTNPRTGAKGLLPSNYVKPMN